MSLLRDSATLRGGKMPAPQFLLRLFSLMQAQVEGGLAEDDGQIGGGEKTGKRHRQKPLAGDRLGFALL